MMGTLATVLARKGIRTHKELHKAEVSGDIEDINRVLRITRIQVNYEVKVPAEKEVEAQEALENYLSQCPAAQSVIGCIEIRHFLKVVAENKSP